MKMTEEALPAREGRGVAVTPPAAPVCAWYGWLRAGWFVGTVSLATETVTFTRRDDGERG